MKKNFAPEIQAAVDRGKERQRAHRDAPAPTPTPRTDTVQTWLDTPVSDSILNTLDRLTEAYNAGVANGTIEPVPEPEPVKPDYGRVSTDAERRERCIAYCKERGLPTDDDSLAHFLGERTASPQID